MSKPTVTLSDDAREQARRLQQQVPTFAEALLSVRWTLADNPRAGKRAPQRGHHTYRRDPAPGSPGIRVTYRYATGEVVITNVELVD